MEEKNLSLTVFFPCYNEEGNVERITQRALEVCRRVSPDFEIIIVNDGSKDSTGEIADRLASQYPEVKVVHNRPNLGYGGALQAGIRNATKEWIFYTDGDGQFDIEEIKKLLPLRGSSTIVSAYRLNRQENFIRKFNAWAWTTLVNRMFKMKVRDIDCAFKLYPSQLFREIQCRSMGALIDSEILAKATNVGYEIKQIGVQHFPRASGEQSGANLKVILKAFQELWKFRRQLRPKR
jgi:glycosyltransferase involved in cell wall biosynthesis